MIKYRFKQVGNIRNPSWVVQKRKLFFFWEDYYVRNILIKVSKFESAYPTLESVLNIKIKDVIGLPSDNFLQIIYQNKD